MTLDTKALRELPASFIRNCEIVGRRDETAGPLPDEWLFRQTEEGHVLVRLDGYAVVPKEQYRALLDAADALAQAQEEARGLREACAKIRVLVKDDYSAKAEIIRSTLDALAGKGGGA